MPSIMDANMRRPTPPSTGAAITCFLYAGQTTLSSSGAGRGGSITVELQHDMFSVVAREERRQMLIATCQDKNHTNELVVVLPILDVTVVARQPLWLITVV